MRTEKSKTINKWGVRLVGCYFLISAISDVYKLITGTRHTQGFMGFDLGLALNGEPIDIMAWIGVYIFFYTGFHLMRFDGRGRDWALILFCLVTISTGIFFVLTFVFSIYPSNPQWLMERKDSAIILRLIAGGLFILYATPVYFLMRKDIKELFQKTNETIEGNS